MILFSLLLTHTLISCVAAVARFEPISVTDVSLVIRMIKGSNVSTFDMFVEIFDLDRLIEYRKTQLKGSTRDQLFSFDGLTPGTWFAFRIHYQLYYENSQQSQHDLKTKQLGSASEKQRTPASDNYLRFLEICLVKLVDRSQLNPKISITCHLDVMELSYRSAALCDALKRRKAAIAQKIGAVLYESVEEIVVRTKESPNEDPTRINDNIAFIDDLFLTKENIYVGVASAFKDIKKVITVIVPELRCSKSVLKPLAQQVIKHASFHFDLTPLGDSDNKCTRICVFPFLRVAIHNRTSETFRGKEWCGSLDEAQKLISSGTVLDGFNQLQFAVIIITRILTLGF